MRRLLGWMLALGACVEVPPYTPPIGVTWIESPSGTGGVASSQPVKLHFSGSSKFPYPDSLQVFGTEVMGQSGQAMCNVEDQIGIALYPAPRITSATSALVNGDNTLVPILRGPAAVKVKVTWGASYDCSNGNHYPDGSSTFTMFPNGRIVRYDAVHASDDMPAVADSCVSSSCSTDSTWFVTSFWTFDTSQFDGLLAQTLMSPIDSLPQGMDYEALDSACVQSGVASSVTVTWREEMQNRARKPSPTTIALIHNIFGGTDIAHLDEPHANITSSLTVAASACVDGGTPHTDRDIAANAMVHIADEPVRAGTDGIFGGDGVFTDAPGVSVPITPFEIVGPTSGPFAVWLRFPQTLDSMRLEKSIPTSRPWYVPQRVDDDEWIIYFLDPLDGTQTITVNPQ